MDGLHFAKSLFSHHFSDWNRNVNCLTICCSLMHFVLWYVCVVLVHNFNYNFFEITTWQCKLFIHLSIHKQFHLLIVQMHSNCTNRIILTLSEFQCHLLIEKYFIRVNLPWKMDFQTKILAMNIFMKWNYSVVYQKWIGFVRMNKIIHDRVMITQRTRVWRYNFTVRIVAILQQCLIC